MENKGYKKIADNARRIANVFKDAGFFAFYDKYKFYADVIEDLLGKVEAAESRVKELEFNRPVQVDGDVFDLAQKLAMVTVERDKYKFLYEHKNTPKSPFDEDGDIMACANCGSGEFLYNEDGNRNNYCGQCGQRIDWCDFE